VDDGGSLGHRRWERQINVSETVGIVATEIEEVAARLDMAHRTRVAIPRPTATYTGLTVHQAYGIQQRQVEMWTESGRSVRGHKVGLTSAAMRRQLGVDQPDYGHLMDDMFHLESTPIDSQLYTAPRIEPEIAFILGEPLAGPGLTVAEVIRAVEYVVPALEVIDSRVKDWDITLADTIADNASSGGVVVGATPVRLSDVDLRTIGVVLSRRGQIGATGCGAAVVGSPANALVWLANTLGVLGVTMQSGNVILSGSMTMAIPVSSGDTVVATFGGMGSVTAVFSSES
jgi:2-keto-4-pentenoate hydratase